MNKPTSTAPELAKSMSWKKKVALGFLALFALIFLFLVVEHFRGTWGLARCKSRMAAKGEPLTIGAAMQPPAPENENGMPALLSAATMVGQLPWKLQPPTAAYAAPGKVVVITRVPEWPASGRPRTNVTWSAVREVMRSREDALTEAIKALQYPKFNAALDYYAGWSLRLPHYPQFLHLIRFFYAAALECLHRGDFEKGTDFLEGAIRLAGAAEGEALVFPQLVRMAIARMAFESTWQAAHADGLPDHLLKRLQAAWAEQDFLKPMDRTFSMEHIILSHEFQRFRDGDLPLDKWIYLTGDSTPPFPRVDSPITLLVGIIEHTPEFFRNGIYTPVWKFAWSHQDELECLKKAERGLDIWKAAVDQQTCAPVRNLGQWDYRNIEEHGESDPHQEFYDRMRYVIAPRADRFYAGMKRAFCTQTLRELALTGLALQRYKLRFGKPPENLEQLIPEFLLKSPRDFMNGHVLQYRNGVLYSVGLDGEDNGGNVGKPVVKEFNILHGKDFLWPQEASPEEVKRRFETGE